MELAILLLHVLTPFSLASSSQVGLLSIPRFDVVGETKTPYPSNINASVSTLPFLHRLQENTTSENKTQTSYDAELQRNISLVTKNDDTSNEKKTNVNGSTKALENNERDSTLLPSKGDNASLEITELNFCIDTNSPSILMGDDIVTITGKVIFPPPYHTGKLPEPSCLVIQLKDLTFLYTSSDLVASIEIDVSEQEVNGSIEYSFNSSKPIESHLNRMFIVTAILNTGWCHKKGSNEWIRRGDLLSIKRHIIPLSTKQRFYQQNINLVCYGCARMNPASLPYGRYLGHMEPMEAKSPIDGLVPVTEMSDDIISISGEIEFPRPLYELPITSCVVIKLKDISYQDASSNVLASNVFSVTGRNVGRIKYSLTSKKPAKDNLDHVTIVTAVVNVGWCKSETSDEWLREGDFLSVMRHRVFLKDDEDSYTRDIGVVCYFCMEKRGIDDIDATGEPMTITLKSPEISTERMVQVENVTEPEDSQRNPDDSETDGKFIKISGDVVLPRVMGTLPNVSCLLVKIKDISSMDGSANILASTNIDLSEQYASRNIKYLLESKKPVTEHLNRMFALSAVLNIGWCKNNKSSEWIRSGDYLSVKRHHVIFNSMENEYSMDISLECYDDCNEEVSATTEPVTDVIGTTGMEEYVTATPLPTEEMDTYDPDEITVTMSNDTMHISGNIIFPVASKVLPQSSCLTVNIKDVTLPDVPSNALATTQIDVSWQNISDMNLRYEFNARKPVESHLNRRFTLNAVVNVGWCQKGDYVWLRKGDFLSVARHRIRLRSDNNYYDKDINVICYSCNERFEKDSGMVVPGGVHEDEIDEIDDFVPTELSNEMLTIDGEIVFPDELGSLPKQSCLVVKLRDALRFDVFSDILGSMTIDIGETYINKNMEYTFKSRKPVSKYFRRMFTLTAVVNLGWCSRDTRSNELVRKGDYLSATSNYLMFEESRNIYGQNIKVVCYACGEADDFTSRIRFTTATPEKKEVITDESRTVSGHYSGVKGYRGEEGEKGDLGRVGNVGPPGLRGPFGYQGPDGEFGNLGPPGVKGRRGLRGIDGLSGFRNGPKGIRGERGPPGGYGLQGNRGFKGYKGQAGEHGPPGVNGQMGNHGEGGPFGPPGERGFPGKKGAEGKMGFQGAKGKVGQPGPHGKTGNQGMQGDPGDNGDQGVKGHIGSVGHMGFTGEDGDPGKVGKVGPPGAPGTQGDNGYAGLPGKFGGRGIHGEPGERGEIGSTGGKGHNGFDGAQGHIGKMGDHGLRGIRGLAGEIGPQGKRGTKGAKGAKGFIGFIGYKGIPGTAGQHGVSGLPGDKGADGTHGEKGPRGDKGRKGAMGTRGLEGATGNVGPRGVQGEDGTDGHDGDKGSRGDPGDTGPMGEKGSRGPIGSPGRPGIKGRKGGRGIVGTRGDVGAKGEEGYPGHPGEPGDRGHYGQQGLKGPTGEDGEVGQAGPKGLEGDLGTEGKTGEAGRKGARGDPGLDGEKGPQGMKGEKGLNGLLGPEGPDGPDGPAGEPGIEGITGPMGKPGTFGSIGPDGKPGHRGMVGKPGVAGSVGRKGDRGKPGKRGHRGRTGRRGAPGPVGFKGTRGFPGEKGLQGDQGKSGYPGERGATGTRGDDGTTGPIGFAGHKGMKGPVGKKGYPGPVGIRGLPGVEGPQGVQGQDGLPGTPGAYGKAGEPGPPGNPGEEGPVGVVGPIGPRGETGLQGNQGHRGKRGKTGTEGVSGDRGSRGQPGDRGTQGSKGDYGRNGIEGDHGSHGPSGDQGVPGARGKRGIRGQEGLPGIGGRRGNVGKAGEAGKDGKDGVDGKPGKPGVLGMKGEEGTQGEPGDQGERGEKGLGGDNGPQGDEGDMGREGEKGELGPLGSKGSRGQPGVRGSPGNEGNQGDRGDSSRAIGPHGPVGEEGPQGMRGLVGDIGKKGVIGTMGIKGEDGPPGFQGPPGANGKPGLSGNMGRSGFQGARGHRGHKGAKGAIGAGGYHGDTGQKGEDGYPGRKGQGGEDGPVGLKGPPGAPPIESLIPNARWRTYYQKNPTQFYQAVAGEYLTYISTEVDNIKYPQGTKSNPALNCKEIHDNKRYTKNGIYWIDPTRGCAWDAFVVYCNFTAGGESCLVNTTSVNVEVLRNDENDEILLSKYNQISYGISRPQLNFIRILSGHVWQEITLHCISPVGDRGNIQLMGWNKKIFNAADRNRLSVFSNTCDKASKAKPGKLVLRMYTEMDLSDLPIMDMAIKNENIDSVEFGRTCFL